MSASQSVKLLFASVAAARCVGSQVTGLPGLEPAGPAHSCRAPVLVGSSPGGEAKLARLAGVGGLSRLSRLSRLSQSLPVGHFSRF